MNASRRLSVRAVAVCLIARRGISRQCADQTRPRSQSANRSGIHEQDSRIYNRAILQFAADRLPAGFAKRADSESRARRRCRRARQVALRGRRLQVHAHARECEPARESVFNRHDRRRSRDDRGGGRFRAIACEAR